MQKGLVSLERILWKILVGRDHLVRRGQCIACAVVYKVPNLVCNGHWELALQLFPTVLQPMLRRVLCALWHSFSAQMRKEVTILLTVLQICPSHADELVGKVHEGKIAGK